MVLEIMRIGISVIILFVSIGLTLISITNNATAQISTSSTLFGVDGFGNPGGSGSLYIINTSTGAVTLVGAIGETWGSPRGCNGIDFHRVTLVLYGICFDGSIGDSRLVIINPNSGAITSTIGTGLGTSLRTMDMSFDPTTDILYVMQRAAGGGSNIELFTVDLTSGVAAAVSGSSVGGGITAAGNAIAFNAAGTLFLSNDPGASNDLYTINKATEATLTSFLNTGYSGFTGAATLIGGRNNAGDIDPASGVFATITNDGFGGGGPRYLSTTGLAGAGTTHIGTTNPQMHGIAFQPAPLVVGGVGIPIDTTALLIAGVQSSTMWMIPVLAFIGIAGLVIFKIKSKANQS